MATSISKPDVFNRTDWLVYGGLCLMATVFAIWATVTPGNAVGGLVLTWIVCAAFYVLTIAWYFHKKKALEVYKYITAHGLIIGWTDNAYALRPEPVESATEELISKMLARYPDAPSALKGCAVIFREPAWYQYTPGFPVRKVAGIQNDVQIEVGFNSDLEKTAFEHELAHRVLQVYAGDPPEETAHKIFSELGIS